MSSLEKGVNRVTFTIQKSAPTKRWADMTSPSSTSSRRVFFFVHPTDSCTHSRCRFSCHRSRPLSLSTCDRHHSSLFLPGLPASSCVFTHTHTQCTVASREVETTLFDPASVFLSTQWWSRQPSLPVLFLYTIKKLSPQPASFYKPPRNQRKSEKPYDFPLKFFLWFFYEFSNLWYFRIFLWFL